MLGAGAGAAQAEGSELPPVEYLAMARPPKPSHAQRAAAAEKKVGKQGNKGTTPAPKPATGAVTPSVPQPMPATPAPIPQPAVVPSVPQPMPATVTPSPAVASAQPAVAVPPKPSFAARADNYFSGGALGPDPVAQLAKGVGGAAYELGRYAPTAFVVGAGAPLVPRLLRFYQGLFDDGSGGITPAPAAPAAVPQPAEESMESIFQNYQPGDSFKNEQPPAPAMNQSTNTINTLRNMLAGMPRNPIGRM